MQKWKRIPLPQAFKLVTFVVIKLNSILAYMESNLKVKSTGLNSPKGAGKMWRHFRKWKALKKISNLLIF